MWLLVLPFHHWATIAVVVVWSAATGTLTQDLSMIIFLCLFLPSPVFNLFFKSSLPLLCSNWCLVSTSKLSVASFGSTPIPSPGPISARFLHIRNIEIVNSNSTAHNWPYNLLPILIPVSQRLLAGVCEYEVQCKSVQSTNTNAVYNPASPPPQ